MTIIQHALTSPTTGLQEITLRIGRDILAKRRLRANADDGSEFGFDLAQPLADGAAFFETAAARYVIAQQPEPVIEIPINGDAAHVTRLGWMIGNLHFPVEISPTALWITDDPAVRQMLARERIAFCGVTRAFHPLSSGHSHGH